MQLYGALPSPFVRKIRVLLLEAQADDKVEFIISGGTPLMQDNLPTEHNPLGKIPCLTRPDGPALFDSRVIARFLDDHFAAGLYPAAPRLWECLTLEAMADGILDAAVLMVYESRLRPEDIRFDAYVAAQWSKIIRALAQIESRWMAYLAGPLDMAHIGVGAALGYLDFRHPSRDWRGDHPALSGWYDKFGARPSMQQTQPVDG